MKREMRLSIEKNELEVIGNLHGVVHRRKILLTKMDEEHEKAVQEFEDNRMKMVG